MNIDEKRYIQLKAAGLTKSQIAAWLGINHQTLFAWMKEHGYSAPNAGKPKKVIDEQKFLEHYNSGKSNKQISKSIGVCLTLLRHWMQDHGYTSNVTTSRDANHVEWLRLYNSGATDKEIAEKTNARIITIIKWRKLYNYAPNSPFAESMDERIKLYNEGKSDREIAEILGMEPISIWTWRNNHKLPFNKMKTIADKKHSKFAELYTRGYNDSKIAKSCRCSRNTVVKWRKHTNRENVNINKRKQ